VLDTLAATVTAYGIDRLYEAVFASTAGEDAGGVQTLAWEDAVRTAASVPAKAANAVGRWREAAWDGKLPPALMPRTYFDSMGEHLESLAYELALDSTGKGKEQRQTALRAVFEKLAALGLLTPRPSETRVPALLPAFLPRALEHLHPPAIAPPYPATFLPRTLLPLSASALSALAGALLSHLPARLPPLEAKPEQAVRRAADVLTGFLGQPGVGGEAWTALVPALLKRMSGTDSDGDASHAAARRMVVAWVGSGGKSREFSRYGRETDDSGCRTH
jgi:hypothetical protein